MGVLGDVWESYFGNEEVQRLSMGLARSVALFAGSVVLMRQFGELMAI